MSSCSTVYIPDRHWLVASIAGFWLLGKAKGITKFTIYNVCSAFKVGVPRTHYGPPAYVPNELRELMFCYSTGAYDTGLRARSENG